MAYEGSSGVTVFSNWESAIKDAIESNKHQIANHFEQGEADAYLKIHQFPEIPNWIEFEFGDVFEGECDWEHTIDVIEHEVRD
jgi:hypothetical protein